MAAMKRKTLGVLVVVGVALVGVTVGCNLAGSTPGPIYETTDLAFSANVGSVAVQALGQSPDDLVRVEVVVSGEDEFGVFQDPLTSAELTETAGVWEGVITGLPIGPVLTFTVTGYDSAGVAIYEGTVEQALSDSNDALTVPLSPVTEPGDELLFPIVTGITRASSVGTLGSSTVTLTMTASANEPLEVTFTAQAGSFTPAVQDITADGAGSADAATTYNAPSSTGTYTHTVKVVNRQGNSVEVDFSVEVVVSSDGEATLQTTFAPSVTALHGGRSGSTVTWEAAVADDDLPEALGFSWSFSQSGGTAGAAFSADPTANPAALTGYDETVTGTITLTVTDATVPAPLSTTVTFGLVAGQFPDVVVSEPGGTVPALAAEMIDLFNAERAANSLPPLVFNEALYDAAGDHATDMAQNDFLDHTGSDGSTFVQRVDRYDQTLIARGEVIAAGPESASATFDLWKSSADHVAIILDAGATLVGVARAYDASSTHGYYWTAVFGDS
jgi:uncharacterized protein YkwD